MEFNFFHKILQPKSFAVEFGFFFLWRIFSFEEFLSIQFCFQGLIFSRTVDSAHTSRLDDADRGVAASLTYLRILHWAEYTSASAIRPGAIQRVRKLLVNLLRRRVRMAHLQLRRSWLCLPTQTSGNHGEAADRTLLLLKMLCCFGSGRRTFRELCSISHRLNVWRWWRWSSISCSPITRCSFNSVVFP